MSQTFTAEAEISGSIEPSGLEVSWSDSQIVLSYDGEASVIPLTGSGMVAHRDKFFVAEHHNEDLINLAIGAYEEHCEAQGK